MQKKIRTFFKLIYGDQTLIILASFKTAIEVTELRVTAVHRSDKRELSCVLKLVCWSHTELSVREQSSLTNDRKTLKI